MPKDGPPPPGQNCKLTPEQRQVLWELSRDISIGLRRLKARNPARGRQILDEIARELGGERGKQ
jgi:hypothetical protein